MEILLWLLPAAVVTVLAMCWVAWVGRDRPAAEDRSPAARERARERFAEAIEREHPGRGRPSTAREPLAGPFDRRGRDRSTGVAVRRSRRSA